MVELLPPRIIKMVHQIFGFIVRRRRLFLLKLFVIFFFVITLLLWTRVQKSTDEVGNALKIQSVINAENYQKADGPIAAQFLGESNHLNEEKNVRVLSKPSPKHKYDFRKSENSMAEVLERRKQVLQENTDEFLTPILADYKYEEVDLSSRRTSGVDDYDEEIEDDLKRVKEGLGDRGKKAKVPDYQEAVADAIMKKDAFNRLLSEMISPNRSVPDTREPACRSETYEDDLPSMSVVVIYTNEAFTSLIRTIHSIINRTPNKYLEEIILVDDFSDHRDLKGKLDRYIATKYPFGKVRLVRLKQRAGLIRARMIGAHLAIGDVIAFLDAHVECGEMWAEPMLARIKEERTAVVCPIIDVIDDKTMEYYHGNGEFFQIGGFTWSGHFTWINIPSYEAARKKSHHSPTRSPTMAGGLFAIDRKYFWEIGSYDSDMQLWGGENLEMSFRIWQCGGSVEVIPCSRVGHIFRNFHPYSFPNNVDSHGLNTARLAEVWMDEYKDLFYSHRKELKYADYGDVTKRITFRKRANCKSFRWFLDNVYKEKFQMQFGSLLYGQVKNEETNQCLDNMQHTESEEYQLSIYPCHSTLYPSQTFMLSKEQSLRRENECASVGAQQTTVQMVQCEHIHSKDKWEYKDSQLYNLRSDKCLTVVSDDGKKSLEMQDCMKLNSQTWLFDSYKDPNE